MADARIARTWWRVCIRKAQRRRWKVTRKPSSTPSPSCRWCISRQRNSNTAFRSTGWGAASGRLGGRVLGAVVEKVSEQRLGDYLAAQVWGPLGMRDATFHPTEAQRARLARQFPNDPLTGRAQAIKLVDTPPEFGWGGAGSV